MVLTQSQALQLASEARDRGDREANRKYSNIARDLSRRTTSGDQNVNYFDRESNRVVHTQAGSDIYVEQISGESDRYVPVNREQISEIREQLTQSRPQDLFVPFQRIQKGGETQYTVEQGSEPGTVLITHPPPLGSDPKWTVTYDVGGGDRSRSFSSEQEAKDFMDTLISSSEAKRDDFREKGFTLSGGLSFADYLVAGPPEPTELQRTRSEAGLPQIGIPGPGIIKPGSISEKLSEISVGALVNTEKPFKFFTDPLRSTDQYLAKLSLELSKNPLLGTSAYLASIGIGVAAMGIDVATFPYRPSLWVESAGAVKGLIFDSKVRESAFDTIKKDPFRFVSTLIGGAYVGGKLQTYTSPLTYVDVEIPLAGGFSARGRGLFFKSTKITGDIKIFDAERNIVNSFDDALMIKPSAGATRGYVPQTSIDTAITTDLMGFLNYNPLELEKVVNVRDIIQAVKDRPSKFIDDILPTQTGTLSVAGVSAFKDWALKNVDNVEKVYGSFPVKGQLKPDIGFTLMDDVKGEVTSTRLPGDIDIVLKGSEESIGSLVDDLVDDLNKAGETVRVSIDNPFLIESKIKGETYAHAIDVHVSGIPTPDAVFPYEFGFKTDLPTIDIEGIPSQSAGEQAVKKGGSILGFKDDRTLGPVGHRSKDIVDFLHVAKTLDASRTLSSKSLEFKIKRVMELYNAQLKDAIPIIDDIVVKQEFTFKPPSDTISSLKSSGGASVDSVGKALSIALPASAFLGPKIKDYKTSPSIPSPSSSTKSPYPSLKIPSLKIPSLSSSPSPTTTILKKLIIPSMKPSPFKKTSPSPFTIPSIKTPSLSPTPSPSPSKFISPPITIPSITISPITPPSPPSPYMFTPPSSPSPYTFTPPPPPPPTTSIVKRIKKKKKPKTEDLFKIKKKGVYELRIDKIVKGLLKL